MGNFGQKMRKCAAETKEIPKLADKQPISTRTCRSVYRKGVLLDDPIVRLRCVGMHLR